MYFVVLTKWKQPPSKEMLPRMEEYTKMIKDLEKQGIKIRTYWTLGRYDGVTIMEAPSEKDATKVLLPWQDVVHTETMVAIPREEALKLL